jgi:hypothetical protein
MEVIIDTQTVSDAGFNTYLTREIFMTEDQNLMIESRYTDASNLVGGIIGSEGILYLGSKQIRLDGKNKRIIINDGTTDRVLIGYQQGGF